MADNITEMLQTQGVDPRLAGGRPGNLLEVSIAVGQNHLTESEIAGLLYMSGVQKETFDALSLKTKEIVFDGLFHLWKIDRFGRVIEKEDTKKLGGIEGIKRTVERELDEIQRSYHGKNEWLPISVGLLIKSATEKEVEKRSNYKGGTCREADNYIKRLSRARDSYKGVSAGNVSGYEDRDRVNNYLVQERDPSIEELRKVFHGFHQIVAVIPAPSESS